MDDRLEIVPATTPQIDSELEATFHALTGQLAPRSQKQYRSDAKHFAQWLGEHNLLLQTVSRDDMIEYRRHLAETYPVASTASRMLVVAKRLLDEATRRGVLSVNPAADIKGFKSGDAHNETTHTALTKAQTRALLEAVDRSTARGKRDYALLALLVFTGMRRAECAGLTIGDLRQEQGHHVAVIRHGKGNKRRIAKIPVQVRRALDEYLADLAKAALSPSTATPLFIQFRKGDNPDKSMRGLSTNAIENIVKFYANAAALEVHLSPHGLRASFVTLALEGGAKLQQVQYAVGHADPRTTERYQRRKLNLDDHASDFIKI
ncbi:MAG TPA: tyrosine-type recombinase/integrase [Chloroflexia bacterium]|nr:tyrosine-type recombinase/integrase [Chloroflexia bacterium]